MKLIKFFLFLLLLPMFLLSQTKQADVFPAGGGQSENSTYKNFGTFGQPSAGTSSNSSYKNNEGFLYGQSENIPTLTTTIVSLITYTGASSGGNISSDGGLSVTARGVCWNTTGSPTIADSKTTNGIGIGAFSSAITGLTYNTLYYVRAYATNTIGTAYGNEITFTTIPTLGEWGLIAMGMLFAGLGGWFVWRKVV